MWRDPEMFLELPNEIRAVFKSAFHSNVGDRFVVFQKHFLSEIQAKIQQIFVETFSRHPSEKAGKVIVVEAAGAGNLLHRERVGAMLLHIFQSGLKREDFKNVIDLELGSDDLKKYLSGETIETDLVGWGVVCVDGFTLGLFKGDGRIAKNHYPKGLRKQF